MCSPDPIQIAEKKQVEVMMPAAPIHAPQEQKRVNAEPQQLDLHGTRLVDSAEALSLYLQHLSPSPVAADMPAQDENLSYKARKRREKKVARQKEQYQELGKTNRLLRLEEVASLPLFRSEYGQKSWMNDKVSHSDLTREETMRKILEKDDYSNFENLDAVMRNVVASSALAKFIRDYQVTEDSNPETLCRQIQERTEGVSGLLNPGLRLALSLAQNTEGFSQKMKDMLRALDEAMSTAVMVATLTHEPEQATVEKYFRDKQAKDPAGEANAAIAANQAQQIQIAKRLLLMQLSDFQTFTTTGTMQRWKKPMAVALSHCSRVVLTLPAEDDAYSSKTHQENMWRAIMTTNGQNLARDNRRGGSTHSVAVRKVTARPTYKDTASKEKKVLVNMVGQRGMNCAIGGLGNVGIGGKTLCNDGSCGHFYSMYKEADSTHYGAMLMGLESDAHGVTNQMGHTHDIHATPEKASSLGGQRVDEIGKKYGGRQCFLDDISASDITVWMQRLESYMQSVQNNAAGREDYDKIMELLAGKRMSRESWTFLMGKIGVPPEVRGWDRL